MSVMHFLRRGRRFGIGEISSTYTTEHPIVTDWAIRVLANGGAAPTLATKLALTTYFNALDAAGLTSSILALNCFVPDNLIAAITPQIKTAGGVIGGTARCNDPWTNHSFVSGDLSVNGLIGNGSSKYLQTGFNPNTALANNTSVGLTAYLVSATGYAICGGADSAFTQALALQTMNSGNSYFECFTYTGNDAIVLSATALSGFISGNRTAANALALYEGSSVPGFQTLGTKSSAGSAVRPSYEVYFHAINNAGSPLYNGTQKISFGAVHLGFNSTQANAFYTPTQALRVALGGGYL